MLSHFTHHILTALGVPLLPFIRDYFNLDYTQSGFVISAFTLSYGISQLPAGWLADRIGTRILLTVGICGVALAGFLIALSPTYLFMLIIFILMGILGGGYHPAAPPLIFASVDAKNQGGALGLHFVGGSASHFLAPIIGVAIAMSIGWRNTYAVLAAPTIIFGIVFYFLLGKHVNTKQMETAMQDDIAGSNSFGSGELPRLVTVICLTSLVTALLLSTAVFIPLYMVDHFGTSESVAAIFLSIFYSAGIWAAPLAGYLSDRVGRIPLLVVMCFIAAVTAFLMNVAPYGFAFGAVLLLLGMANASRMPITEAYVVGHTPQRYRSTVLGFYYFAGTEGSGFLAPILGLLIDNYGFTTTFNTVAASLLVVTVTCLTLLYLFRR